MTLRIPAVLFALAAAAVAGCSSAPPARSEPVEVSGTVLLASGQPVKDVTLNFFPTSSAQIQVPVQLKGDGKFSAKLIPGSYTIAFEGKEAAMAAVPKSYHSNSADHKFEVASGGATGVTIKLEN